MHEVLAVSYAQETDLVLAHLCRLKRSAVSLER